MAKTDGDRGRPSECECVSIDTLRGRPKVFIATRMNEVGGGERGGIDEYEGVCVCDEVADNIAR